MNANCKMASGLNLLLQAADYQYYFKWSRKGTATVTQGSRGPLLIFGLPDSPQVTSAAKPAAITIGQTCQPP